MNDAGKHFYSKCTFDSFRKDVFQVETGSLGELQKIQLRSDDTGDSPDWLIEKVGCTIYFIFLRFIAFSFNL